MCGRYTDVRESSQTGLTSVALIALGHTRCSFCGEILEEGHRLVATSDGPPFIVPGLPYLYDSAAHLTCFNRWPLRRVYKRHELLSPGLLDPTWPPGARWAVIEWSKKHVKAGLPSGPQWIQPAHFVIPDPPTDDRWSLICDFDPPPSAQDTPTLTRVRFLAGTAPTHLLISGTQFALYDPGYLDAHVYVL